MSSTVQLNTRIDADLKREGDVVFRRAGLTPSEVVRGVWSYAAKHQDVPAFLKPEESDDHEAWTRLVDEGAGLALKLARGEASLPSMASNDLARDDNGNGWYGQAEDDMYEGMVDEYEQLLQD